MCMCFKNAGEYLSWVLTCLSICDVSTWKSAKLSILVCPLLSMVLGSLCIESLCIVSPWEFVWGLWEFMYCVWLFQSVSRYVCMGECIYGTGYMFLWPCISEIILYMNHVIGSNYFQVFVSKLVCVLVWVHSSVCLGILCLWIRSMCVSVFNT